MSQRERESCPSSKVLELASLEQQRRAAVPRLGLSRSHFCTRYIRRVYYRKFRSSEKRKLFGILFSFIFSSSQQGYLGYVAGYRCNKERN